MWLRVVYIIKEKKKVKESVRAGVPGEKEIESHFILAYLR